VYTQYYAYMRSCIVREKNHTMDCGHCMILIDIIQYSLLYSQTQDLIEIMANKSYGKYNIIVVYHVIVPFKNPTGAIPL
jgi:hypothetical protein